MISYKKVRKFKPVLITAVSAQWRENLASMLIDFGPTWPFKVLLQLYRPDADSICGLLFLYSDFSSI